jgi:hypothetical protein
MIVMEQWVATRENRQWVSSHQEKPPALARDNSARLAIICYIIYIIAISMPQTKIDLITGKLDVKCISKIVYG